MMNIEKILEEKKKELSNISAPINLEERLYKALKGKRNNKMKQLSLIAASVILLFSLYNFDSLAYLGKLIIGYDNVMNSDLSKLNELGKGQILDKHQYIGDGITIYLDGIMLDDNQLLVFYRIFREDGNITDYMPSINRMDSFLRGYHYQSSTGEINDNETQIAYVASFEPPGLFTKNLEFNGSVISNNKPLEFSIPFTIDRSKAVGRTIKYNINKTFKVEGTEILFESISASPTLTRIKGDVKFDLKKMISNLINGDIDRVSGIELELLINNEPIERRGASFGTSSPNKSYFEIEYAALPEDANSIKIQIKNLGIYRNIDNSISLDKKSMQTYDIGNEKVEVLDINEINGETFIKVKSKEYTKLYDVSLFSDKGELEYKRTETIDYEKTKDGIFHIRTFIYDGVGENLELNINYMYSKIDINEVIEIPID